MKLSWEFSGRALFLITVDLTLYMHIEQFMSFTHQKGKEGEEIAARYLTGKGYALLEKNWRHTPAEVDLIFRVGKELIFVEVKLRTDGGFSDTDWGIDRKKMRLLSDAAYAYMAQENWTGEFRFDIITVHMDPAGAYRLEHFPDAFFPGLQGF